MSREVPPDLHDEPGKWFPCLLLALLALLALAFPYLLSLADERRPAAAPAIHQVSLLRELPLPPPPPPPPEPEPEPAPAPKPEPAKKPEVSVGEVALREIQASLAAERERRETEAREQKQREEEAKEAAERKRREAAERKQREEAERKKREEEERKREEEERKREEEQRQREQIEEAERLAAEARERAQEAAEARARAAEALAAELRAQAEAEANAARAAQLADLQGIYLGRIKAQIERSMATPSHLQNREDVVVEVLVLLHPDGELRGWPKVTRSSGFPEYDEEAIRAVIQAAPLTLPRDEPELLKEFLRLNLHIRPK